MLRFTVRMTPVVVVFFLLGCGMPGVAWQPDSSGFVYTDKGGKRLASFDLKTKTKRVLVEDTDAPTTMPALRPDGKRLAVARWEQRKGLPPRVQVRIFSLQGKDERQSTWFETQGEEGTETKVQPTQLYWATPDRILLLADRAGIYDLAKDRLIELKKGVPWFVGAPPVRPDGKGFLAYDETPQGVDLY